ncbi:MAG: hypothetical protein ACKOU6_20780, partial [Planctomycetota bacterium]
VVGIGDQSPDEHFSGHSSAGDLSIVPLGTPTNSIRGQGTEGVPEAGVNWLEIARDRLAERIAGGATAPALDSSAGSRIAKYLTGASLPQFPGAKSKDQTAESHRMVAALWPALWGHWLRDIWQATAEADATARWAMDHLYPEGPLMPIRIGDQPYGLIPTTAIKPWESESSVATASQLEMGMAGRLTDLRATWAASVRQTQSVVGKSTSDFMRILSQDALSHQMVTRGALGATGLLEFEQANPVQTAAALAEIQTRIKVVSGIMGRPLPDNGLHLFLEGITNVYLPFVQPTRMPFSHVSGQNRKPLSIEWLLRNLVDFQGDSDSNDELMDFYVQRHNLQQDNEGYLQIRILPDSLLIRLLIYACQLASRGPRGKVDDHWETELW